MPSQRKIKVAIAGLGRSGWGIHARLIEPLKTRYRIVAALDADGGRRKEAEARFDCATSDRYEDLLKNEDVELVVVAMPNHLHAAYTLAALKAGKHVVCEKPMAGSLKEADRMIAAAQRHGRVLSIFQNRRYSPDFLQVRKVIRSGVLGRIALIRIAYQGFGRRWDWQTLKKYEGGSMNNAGPHAIDHALNLFGPDMPRVFCLRDRTLTLGDADDHVKIVLYGKDRPSVEVEITAACPYPQNSWLVMGTQGGLSGNAAELKWKYFNPRRLTRRAVSEVPTPDRSYNSETLPCVEKTWIRDRDRGPNETGFYLDLFKTVRRGAPLEVKPEEVRMQMRVMEACRRQAPV
jgi:scyllo-inositol 2-dehydrogenase (NADP+)